ncbi:Putative nitrogen regulatory protein PII/ATP phosphoribosyltransferase [Septoria linicola]|uniref:ATP phosphoribosyltransferase n=1 Tax=Septoria linicola TaxID=215465 RepID=A0A9Q9B8G3_9PEZI|nr:Putative nitrogen regulatory protein PII/ATP phosphoribosyltransferase [Septoria linicola]
MATTTPSDRFKLIFFTPPQDLPKIKQAIFAAGAGRYPGPGGYTECGFATPGVGQFRPGDSANPHIGEKGKVEEVGEVRFETLCVGRDVTRAAVEALKKAHPYEELAYEVYKLEDF